jgi:heme/copper-type cytochrome/quinol oxidase subunit 2
MVVSLSHLPLRWICVAFLFVMLILAILFLPLPVNAAAGEITVIHLDTSQYEFTPGRVEIHQGDHVVIELTSSDVVHGFYVDGYNIQERIQPGITKRIEFIADRPGKFRYRCSVTCGPMHPFMIGELVIGPNVPFWRSAAATLAAAIGMVIWLWNTKAQVQIQEIANESI